MLFILIYHRVWLIGASTYRMQQKKLCTYYNKHLLAVLHPDHGKSNHDGDAVHLHKRIVQGQYNIMQERKII